MRSRFKQFIILLLGFSSGLPLALSASTLQAWFAVSGIDVVTIGSLALVGQPYMFKFLWAPLLDFLAPAGMERRRGWMLLMQLAVILVLLAMSFCQPTQHTLILAGLATALAFASATQDVAIDAYRADILLEKERGIGAAMAIGGYRLGMLVSGGVALMMADKLGWQLTYQVMALSMLVGVIASLISPSLDTDRAPSIPFSKALSAPIKNYFSRPYAWHFIALILLFKLGETFTSTSGIMTNTFLLQGVGFSLSTVGMVNKLVGVGAVIFGVFIGGVLLTRMCIYDALILFGLLQGVSNLCYCIVSIVGKNMAWLMTTVVFDNIAAGCGNAAILALLMSLCDKRYSATQFALLSAIAISGRILLGPVAGLMVSVMGWTQFFVWTFFLALPGVACAYWFKLNADKTWLGEQA